MIKKILITGSSGQIGSYLVENLVGKYDVVGLDIRGSNNPIIDKITFKGDIRDKNIVNSLIKKVDAVIHTAAQLSIERSIKDPMMDADINIMGTLNLLNAARNNKNISKFIYFSSAAVYGNPRYLPIDENHPLDPVSPYGLSKLTGEKYCFLFYKVFDLPTICVRPFNIYSDRENPRSPYASIITKFIDRVRNSKPLIIYGNGSQLRDFVHAKDVASFIKIILEKENVEGEVYNLGSGKPISILEVAKLILKMYNKAIHENIIYKREEKEKIIDSYADIRKARKIGYKVKVPIEKGIKEIVDIYAQKKEENNEKN